MAGQKGTRTFAGVYELMEFPPYEYREYPKMITVGDETITVNNKVEEDEALGNQAEEPADETASVNVEVYGRRRRSS